MEPVTPEALPGRVALFLPDLSGGGAERVTIDLAAGLASRGVPVDLVLASARGPLLPSVPDSVRVVDLGAGRVLRALRPLRSYLRERRPAALISAMSHANLVAIAAARSVRPRVPVVVTQHNTLSLVVTYTDSMFDRLSPVLIRGLYRYADRIVAVSTGVADDLALTGHIPRGRIDVVVNPVVVDRLLARGEEDPGHPWLSDGTGTVLLGVGRLHEQKDFGTLLRALRLLPHDHRLIVLGEGDERARLEALAAELGVADRVDLPGFVANPYPFFRRADVFVLSSRSEGLPTALIEALPFPIAIVATDCPSGPAEVLAGGRWGRLVPVRDAEALAAAIREEAADPARRPEEAWRPYDPVAVTDQYVALLADVTAGSVRGPVGNAA